MKTISIVAIALMLSATSALAQQRGIGEATAGGDTGNAATAGSTTGDPAASSANHGLNSRTTTTGSNPGGSGTSSSGGRDDNNDGGRDKMGTTGNPAKAQEKSGSQAPSR